MTADAPDFFEVNKKIGELGTAVAALKDGLESIEKFKNVAKVLGNLGSSLGAIGAVIGFASFLADGGVDPVM